ncbi:Cytochrome c oxidase subunit 6 [Tulasnella sp. 332]|nr:Cytochrome c oxidase subunit 6 [Tulasnella sp. 332]
MNRLLSSGTARPLLSAASRSLRAATSPSYTVATPNVIAALSVRHNSHGSGSDAESFADFSKRYTSFFDNAEDLFELQRGLNNCFAYDLVPGVDVIESALRASRRLDTFSTAVRIFEGIREKVENHGQYEMYLQELKGIKEELGIVTKEELFVGEDS